LSSFYEYRGEHFMICVNELQELRCCKRQILEPLLLTLAPFAPHITENSGTGWDTPQSIHQATFLWPM
jgi:leucyl-tRNA synthetase